VCRFMPEELCGCHVDVCSLEMMRVFMYLCRHNLWWFLKGTDDRAEWASVID